MADEDAVESAGEVWCAAAVGDGAVGRVAFEILVLRLPLHFDALALVNVLLCTIDDGDIAQAERNDAAV